MHRTDHNHLVIEVTSEDGKITTYHETTSLLNVLKEFNEYAADERNRRGVELIFNGYSLMRAQEGVVGEGVCHVENPECHIRTSLPSVEHAGKCVKCVERILEEYKI